MTLATPRVPRLDHFPEHFVFHGVRWDFYDRVLEAVGGRHVFVTYDRGDLELMSPSRPHELYKRVIARMIDMTGQELRIRIGGAGSMTMRRQELDRGLEPDECYYVQNASVVHRVTETDLTKEPPPDLVVEMDYSYRTLDREGIYAAMGVPEVWRFDLETLEFLRLSGDKYEAVQESSILGQLPRADVERFVRMRANTPEIDVLEAWGRWLKQFSQR